MQEMQNAALDRFAFSFNFFISNKSYISRNDISNYDFISKLFLKSVHSLIIIVFHYVYMTYVNMNSLQSPLKL